MIFARAMRREFVQNAVAISVALLVILLIGFGVPALGLTGVTSSVIILGTAFGSF